MKGLWTRLAPWAVTAALVFIALALGGRVVALRAENESLRTERILAEVAYKQGQTQLAERTLLAENMINHLGASLRHAEDLARLKVTRLVAQAGFAKEAQAIVVWDAEQQSGLLVAENLPATGANQDYQLWLTAPTSPHPIAGCVFQADASGKASLAFKPDQPVAQATPLAITLEKKGGAAKAAGLVLLSGK